MVILRVKNFGKFVGFPLQNGEERRIDSAVVVITSSVLISDSSPSGCDTFPNELSAACGHHLSSLRIDLIANGAPQKCVDLC
jgi:hypothetical protein